jgi:hypothetical protein
MALGGEVVDLVRPGFLHDPDEVRGIRHVAVMQRQARIGDVRVFVDVLDPARIKTGRPALDPVDPVALAEEEARQVGPVLAGDAGNQGCFLLAHCPRSRLAPPL